MKRKQKNLRPHRDGGEKDRSAVPPSLGLVCDSAPLCRAAGNSAVRTPPVNVGASVAAYLTIGRLGRDSRTHSTPRKYRAFTNPGSLDSRVRRLLAPFTVVAFFDCGQTLPAATSPVNITDVEEGDWQALW